MIKKPVSIQFLAWLIVLVVLLGSVVACGSSESEPVAQIATNIPTTQLPTDIPATVTAEPSPTKTERPTLTATATAEPSPTETRPPTLAPTIEPSPTATAPMGPSPTAVIVDENGVVVTPDLRAVTGETKRITLDESREQVANEHAHESIARTGWGGGGGLGCMADDPLYQWRIYFKPNGLIRIHENASIVVCVDPDDEGLFSIYNAYDQLIHQEPFGPETESSTQTIWHDWESDVLIDPLGTYRFEIETERRRVTEYIEVYSPDEPRLLRVNQDTIVLTGFEPNENVLFYIYTYQQNGEISPLSAVIQDSVDQTGSLIATLDFDTSIGMVGVHGERSGNVRREWDSLAITGSYEPIFWPVSESGVEACHLNSLTGETETRTVKEGAILTSTADLILELNAGDEIIIANTSAVWREEIGWHWRVSVGDIEGWIWEGYIEGCDS